MRKFLPLLVAAALMMGGLAALVRTDNGLAATPAPARIDITPIEANLSLTPGETYDGQFSVINSGDRTFDFRVAVNSFFVKDLTYDTTFDQDNTFGQIVHWVTFDAENFNDVVPHERRAVNYHIDVPKDAPAGGQYAVLFAIVSDQTTDAGVSVRADSRVGLKIYATVAGKTRLDGQVQSVAQSGFYLKSPVAALTMVKNTGNVDFASHYEYRVESLFGRPLFKVTDDRRIMPDTIREVKLSWPDAPTFGIFRTHTTITFLGQTRFDRGGIVIVAPWWLLVMTLFVVGLIVLLIIMLVKKVKKIRRHRRRQARIRAARQLTRERALARWVKRILDKQRRHRL